MKTNKINIKELFSIYDHPGAVLFRAIELKSIHELTKNVNFKEPSLDIGCGDGLISELLFDSKFTYGVDNGEAHDVDEAIKNNRYEKVLLESAEKMSLPDASLNFVFSNSVIEHIPNNKAVLSEVSRLLKPDGYFLFTSPSRVFGKYLFITSLFTKMGLNSLANRYEDKRNKLLNHYHIDDHEIYEKRLSDVGIEIIDHAYCSAPQVMRLWDILTVLSYIGRIFNKNTDKYLTKVFKNKVIKLSNESTISKSIQGNLVILARKFN